MDQHYNVRTTEQNQKAAKILFDKLDVPHKFNFKPLFLKKVLHCNISVKKLLDLLKISTLCY